MTYISQETINIFNDNVDSNVGVENYTDIYRCNWELANVLPKSMERNEKFAFDMEKCINLFNGGNLYDGDVRSTCAFILYCKNVHEFE